MTRSVPARIATATILATCCIALLAPAASAGRSDRSASVSAQPSTTVDSVAEDLQRIVVLCATAPEVEDLDLDDAARDRYDSVVAAARRYKDSPRKKNENRITREYKALVKSVGRESSVDLEQVQASILRASMLEEMDEIRYRAMVVRYENERLERVREEIAELTRVERRLTGNARDDARERLSDRAAELESLGSDAQLARLDLQDALQRQQQTMQTLSNVSKMMHDTAMAVLRKMG